MRTGEDDQRYRRRREAGEASRARTRQRLLDAADELFREQGYVATTVAQIVRRAGVSVQTLYLTWGSKRALLRAAADAAATGRDQPPAPDQWRAAVRDSIERDAAGPGTAARLEALAGAFTSLAERAAPYWAIYRQAAAVDPDIAEDWVATVQARRATLTEVADALPDDGVDRRAVADTLFALAGPDTYALLTEHAGYTSDDYRAWLARTLVASVAAPHQRRRSRSGRERPSGS